MLNLLHNYGYIDGYKGKFNGQFDNIPNIVYPKLFRFSFYTRLPGDIFSNYFYINALNYSAFLDANLFNLILFFSNYS